MRMYPESKNHHFSHIFFQHGNLTYYSTYLQISMYIAYMYLERSVSQNLDIGLIISFVLLYVEDGN